ncbi:hypothetical protein MBLNU459_g3428t1 [Dothideomycetes sp. NU459]
MAAKRKRTAASTAVTHMANGASTNPQVNAEIIDAPDALRASPDSDVDERIAPGPVRTNSDDESPLSDIPEIEVEPPKKKKRSTANKPTAAGKKSAPATNGASHEIDATPKTLPAKKAAPKPAQDDVVDPEAEGDEEAGEEEIQQALSRSPPVHSSYLPLPWKGRLGFACLNTYLRYSTPPVFSSRTCRIASILEHRHPLKDPSQPEHPTKNRPDREQPADVARGQKYVEEIGLANARDIVKMIRWNDRYNIKFLRLSSEMFPFASHEEYGYTLKSFAAETLAEAGKVIAELGHRVTTHPGQFTQLGSPRKSVIDNAIRDLNYHDELLSLLKLPEQLNKDAVMILHLGGVFGDRLATLDRFRENYAKLSQSVKNRVVLENDDVSWSVHDLLPLCEELNIPMVLDFHHHNIIFDSEQLREGTADIVNLFPRIKATWERKGITQKMHYSEPTPAAITGRQRRKHNPRVATLPPCDPEMDLMIEAKDKEQAVFELMRTFKLPGYNTFNDIIPHVRNDDNRLVMQQASKKKKATPKKSGAKKVKKAADEDDEAAALDDNNDYDAASSASADPTSAPIPDEDVGMGGPEGRVYWPPGMEDWLRPKKREVKKKDPTEEKKLTPAQKKKKAAAAAVAAATNIKGEAEPDDDEADSDAAATPATKKAKKALRAKDAAARAKLTNDTAAAATAAAAPAPRKRRPATATKVKKEEEEEEEEEELTPPTSDAGDSDSPALDSDAKGSEPATPLPAKRAPAAAAAAGARQSARARASKAKVSYQEADVSMDEA